MSSDMEDKYLEIFNIVTAHADKVCTDKDQDYKEDIINDCMVKALTLVSEQDFINFTPHEIFTRKILRVFKNRYKYYSNIQIVETPTPINEMRDLERYIMDDYIESIDLVDKVKEVLLEYTSSRDREILKCIYGLGSENKSSRDLAKEIGISQQRVNQLKCNIIEKLRRCKGYVILSDFA